MHAISKLTAQFNRKNPKGKGLLSISVRGHSSDFEEEYRISTRPIKKILKSCSELQSFPLSNKDTTQHSPKPGGKTFPYKCLGLFK